MIGNADDLVGLAVITQFTAGQVIEGVAFGIALVEGRHHRRSQAHSDGAIVGHEDQLLALWDRKSQQAIPLLAWQYEAQPHQTASPGASTRQDEQACPMRAVPSVPRELPPSTPTAGTLSPLLW